MDDLIADLLDPAVTEMFETDGVDVMAVVVMVKDGKGYGLRCFALGPAESAKILQLIAVGSMPPDVMFRA